MDRVVVPARVSAISIFKIDDEWNKKETKVFKHANIFFCLSIF